MSEIFRWALTLLAFPDPFFLSVPNAASNFRPSHRQEVLRRLVFSLIQYGLWAICCCSTSRDIVHAVSRLIEALIKCIFNVIQARFTRQLFLAPYPFKFGPGA